MSTIMIGSQTWCEYWANFYWERACKYAERAEKYPERAEAFTILAMHDMFISYVWEDRSPWK